jgi:hypothetical protein
MSNIVRNFEIGKSQLIAGQQNDPIVTGNRRLKKSLSRAFATWGGLRQSSGRRFVGPNPGARLRSMLEVSRSKANERSAAMNFSGIITKPLWSPANCCTEILCPCAAAGLVAHQVYAAQRRRFRDGRRRRYFEGR